MSFSRCTHKCNLLAAAFPAHDLFALLHKTGIILQSWFRRRLRSSVAGKSVTHQAHMSRLSRAEEDIVIEFRAVKMPSALQGMSKLSR